MRLLLLCLVLVLSGCMPAERSGQSSLEAPDDLQIAQSPNDDRHYKYLTLKNGLRVLLISDKKTDKSAASLDVHVGSFQNPRDREGLAHFLEHMLFLGTEKYPDASEYQSFIR